MHMRLLIALSLTWLPCLPCLSSPPLRSSTNNPYGYAPYAWVDVGPPNARSGGWCLGFSRSGFALTVGDYNHTSDMCTHYCPGTIYAYWKPARKSAAALNGDEGGSSILGAFVKRLDKSSCLVVPGGFKCSDRVVASTPLNKISILLHASPRNRDYYFGEDPMAECGSDPQCEAFKLLRRTLHAPAASRKWPTADDVQTVRNSPYACVLSYMGLGDVESIGGCYAQLGDNCFASEGNRFCIGNRGSRVGITNGDADASAPIAICEVSSAASLRHRDPACRPTPTEIRDFLVPSSCDATIVSVDRALYEKDHLSVALDVETFNAAAQAGHVIMKVSFDGCLLPIASTGEGFSQVVETVAETLSKVMVSASSMAIMLDAADWGASECSRTDWQSAEITSEVAALASALIRHGVLKVFLRLPRSLALLNDIDFSRLGAFEAFVTPAGAVDMSRAGHCQNMWVSASGDESSKGVMPYLLTLLRRGVRANKVIFTLSLTGGRKISPLKLGDSDITAELSLGDMETNPALKCNEDLNTKCCSGSSVTVWARDVIANVTMTSTSFETLKQLPELVAVAFAINQFVIAPVDSDFRRGVRSDTPAILGITSAVHRLRDWKRQQIVAGMATGSRIGRSGRSASHLDNLGSWKKDDVAVPETPYKDPASGSKNCLDPEYNIGLSNTVVCPGLIAAHGALGIFKEPHKEMYSTSYDKIYIANLYELESCTQGEPSKRATVSTRPPQIAVNVNTFIPTTDRAHYMVGILDSEQLVEYVPPVNEVCVAYSTGERVHSMNLVSVDDSYSADTPVVDGDRGLIVKPVEALYLVSNFTPGIDYVNMNVSCVNYDVSALQPCLIAICGGDNSCRRDYGRLCKSAHEIINDARRAGDMMRQGLQELAMQEKKSKMYELPDNAPFPWLDKPQGGRGRHKRFAFGVVTGMAALALAWHVSNRMDNLGDQMDALKNSYVSVTNKVVEVSHKLNANIALVNSRIDDQENMLEKNNQIANSNFAMIRDTLMRNTEAALRDTNVKFSVLASYQMWYAQMQSVTHQMLQAAMHTKFMAAGVENCLRQIASKRSGSCPSGMTIMREHPGLTDFPTVGTALYKDRKLFIVHSVPRTVEKTTVRGIIPMPRMSTDGVPCWPDYNVWLIDGHYYEPSECHGKYCHVPEPHDRYLRCVEDPGECKTVCAPCHRGVCYRDKKVTWTEGSVAIEIKSPPLRQLSKLHISDGPVSFSDLLKDKIPGMSEMGLLQAINTSVTLVDVREDLENVTRSLLEFDKRYEELSASRVTLGGWLSGIGSVAALWTSVAILVVWCTVLSAGICYTIFCGGGGGGNGGLVLLNQTRKRSKVL